MKRRSFTLFLLALTLGVGAAMFANQWFQSRLNPVPVAEASTVPVVVAALKIPFGQKIEATQLKTIGWPNDQMPADVFHAKSEVEGRVASQSILPGELILASRIVEHNQGSTLSAIISPNMRAVTVRVNDVIGVAGFLLPGNRVDILATRVENRRAHTRTILEDLKVLAVDQTASPDKDQPLVVRAVTLEMDPQDAEALVKATQEGNVQLVLRNPGDDSRIAQAEPPKPAPVKKPVRPRRRPVRRDDSAAVTVIRGTSVDVSKIKL